MLRLIAFTGLVMTLLPSILVFTGHLSFSANKNLMAIGMVLWFGASTLQRNKP